MSWLSRISVANRKLAALITIIVVAFGAYAASSLKQQLIPNLSFPAVTVTATYAGASPQVVEDQVVEPIEDAVKSVDGIETVTSTSRQGSASVQLQFDYDADVDTKSSEVQQALSRVSTSLPDSVDPQVQKGSTDDQPTMTLAVTSNEDQQELAKRLEDKVVSELKAVDGVNQATVTGERDRVVVITPDSSRLEDAGLTVQSIKTALTSNGSASPGGAVNSDGKSLSIQIGGALTSVGEIEDLWLSADSASGGAAAGVSSAVGSASTSADPVQLKDVATVALKDTDATTLTRTNGKESLGISITMDQDGSSSSISQDVREQLSDLEADLGHDARISVVSDNGPQVRQSVVGLFEEGLLGLLMAVVVIIFFLRSLRSTLVTAVSIPLSLLVALIALWMKDYSLNVLTLGGLTLAVGRVVDDSIVVLENIKRHLGYGEDKRTAILTAVREVSTAVTLSTLTTVAVFVPIALVSGLVGELFGPFSITVVAAMLASLLVSLTIVPALAYWFLKPPKEAQGADPEEFRRKVEEAERNGTLQRAYVPVVNWAIGHRKSVLGIAGVLLVFTFSLTAGIKTSFLGDSGSDSVSVTQTLPEGTDLHTTDSAAKKVEKVIAAVDGVDSYQVTIGSSGGFAVMGAGSSANSASYSIALKDGADSSVVEDTLRDGFDDLKGAGELTVGSNSGFGSSNDIQVDVKSDDDADLKTATEKIEDALKGLAELTDVSSDLSTQSPQISITAKGEEAASYGLTETSIAAAVSEAVQGTEVTQITVDGSARDVLVKTTSSAPSSVSSLNALKISTSRGDVRLDKVATVTRTEAPTKRQRVDGSGAAAVTATPVGDSTGTASTKVQQAIEGLDLPSGVTYEMGGVTADQGDAFSQLGLAILAAIAIVFLLLVGVFRSIRQTLVLLVSIPFAFTGAFALLRVTGTPLGVAALIGMLMLIGIVVTNAIVLMDLVNRYRAAGMSVEEAVREGGRRRLRPILMTALATIFALLPMALGITDSGGFISTPLAVVVIGGLVSSTLLTLVLIPTLYTMVETRRERRAQRRDRRLARRTEPTERESSTLQPQA